MPSLFSIVLGICGEINLHKLSFFLSYVMDHHSHFSSASVVAVAARCVSKYMIHDSWYAVIETPERVRGQTEE